MKDKKTNLGKIVLVDTSIESSESTSKNASGMGSLGIQYIGAYLKNEGCDVEIVTQVGSLENLSEEIIGKNPSYVGFSSMLAKWNDQDKLANIIKNSNQNLTTIVGGAGISGNPHLLDSSNFDYGIKGEGEEALLSLISCLEEDKDVSEIEGLVYRGDFGVLVNSPTRITKLTNNYFRSRNFVFDATNLFKFSF